MSIAIDHPFPVAIVATAAAYITYYIVHQLYFHPLAHIPGPKLAALTTWHEALTDLKGKHHLTLKRLHEQYGPIIRPVPNEVHISDPDFLDTIYATRGRNAAVNIAGTLMVEGSVGASEDFGLHQMRRQALNPCFSPKAVLQLEDLIRRKVGRVGQILEEARQDKQPINMSDVSFAFANDMVRSFSFGSDNNLLSDLVEAKKQREDLARLLTGVKFSKHFPWAPKLARSLPYGLAKKTTPPAIVDLLRFRAKIGEDIEKVLSDKSNDERGPSHSVFYELRDTPILPPEERTMQRFQGEATLVVMAGTESTAKSLGFAIFYLLDSPSVLTGLRSELDAARKEAGGQLPLQQLVNLPYLNGVIQEAHRLSMGVTGRLIRYAPDTTLTYTDPETGKSYALPPRTRMSTNSYIANTNETLYPDPFAFDPDRWIVHDESENEAVNRRKKSMLSLGKGHRKCIGMHLAQAALSLVLAEIVRYDLTLYQTDETDVKMLYDFQISHPRLDSKGIQAIVEGKRP